MKTLQELLKAVRYTHDEIDIASLEWGLNCGPGALCGILNKKPSEIRPHLGDFEAKRYTNPTLMINSLSELVGRENFGAVYRSDDPNGRCVLKHGLIRIQWGGRWCNPGVPMRARYRQTHWIASIQTSDHGNLIFDVNAIHWGNSGWLQATTWEEKLAPWIISECVKGGDGTWWPTHGIEVADGR